MVRTWSNKYIRLNGALFCCFFFQKETLFVLTSEIHLIGKRIFLNNNTNKNQDATGLVNRREHMNLLVYIVSPGTTVFWLYIQKDWIFIRTSLNSRLHRLTSRFVYQSGFFSLATSYLWVELWFQLELRINVNIPRLAWPLCVVIRKKVIAFYLKRKTRTTVTTKLKLEKVLNQYTWRKYEVKCLNSFVYFSFGKPMFTKIDFSSKNWTQHQFISIIVLVRWRRPVASILFILSIRTVNHCCFRSKYSHYGIWFYLQLNIFCMKS